jgi:hypothetical protein
MNQPAAKQRYTYSLNGVNIHITDHRRVDVDIIAVHDLDAALRSVGRMIERFGESPRLAEVREKYEGARAFWKEQATK